jgi:hypothetical protein
MSAADQTAYQRIQNTRREGKWESNHLARFSSISPLTFTFVPTTPSTTTGSSSLRSVGSTNGSGSHSSRRVCSSCVCWGGGGGSQPHCEGQGGDWHLPHLRKITLRTKSRVPLEVLRSLRAISSATSRVWRNGTWEVSRATRRKEGYGESAIIKSPYLCRPRRCSLFSSEEDDLEEQEYENHLDDHMQNRDSIHL